MKKNEYVSPEMEIIEMTMGGMLMVSGETPNGSKDTNDPVFPGSGNNG